MKNIFIEGMQGAGKSTLLNRLQQKMPNYKGYREGDYSPVELAWCSYTTKEQYEAFVTKYYELQEELERHTVTEGERNITEYTRILTDVSGFHKEMEQYEIYNGSVTFEQFQRIIFCRYERFVGSGNFFECSFFQNSIESMMLFYQMEEDEIIKFYEKAYAILKSKDFRLLYLDVRNMEETIGEIRKERVDVEGNELWFPMMMQYFLQSPYGKKHGVKNFEDLIAHFVRRKNLEHTILKEIIGNQALILTAKNYDIEKIVSWCNY